jgi:hypothetical protein
MTLGEQIREGRLFQNYLKNPNQYGFIYFPTDDIVVIQMKQNLDFVLDKMLF